MYIKWFFFSSLCVLCYRCPLYLGYNLFEFQTFNKRYFIWCTVTYSDNIMLYSNISIEDLFFFKKLFPGNILYSERFTISNWRMCVVCKIYGIINTKVFFILSHLPVVLLARVVRKNSFISPKRSSHSFDGFRKIKSKQKTEKKE